MQHFKNTRIVATLSPAVSTEEMLSSFIDNGVNLFRLNFSHGSYEEYAQMISNIKKVRQSKNVNVGILQDLQGPRVRVGTVGDGISITHGQKVVLYYAQNQPGNNLEIKTYIPIDYDLSGVVTQDEEILIEDGLILLKIQSVNLYAHEIVCEAQSTAIIKSRKGVNFPGNAADFPVITQKDKQDLVFGLQQGVDFIAMSFVRSRNDILNLKTLISQVDQVSVYPHIIAKIEKPDAVRDIDEIILEVDGIMVARGDLGIEMPAEQVPIIQKNIIRKCIQAGKSVIVATQMLDSMIRNSRPTRAEVSDVANAVIDHSDAVMLSGETSGGLYPLEAVSMMNRIIQNTEISLYDAITNEDYLIDIAVMEDKTDIYDEIAYGAQHLAKKSKADGIVVYDMDGKSLAHKISKYRAGIPIFVLTNDQDYYYKLALVWGVTALYMAEDQQKDHSHVFKTIRDTYLKDKDTHYFVCVDAKEKGQGSIEIVML